MPGLLIKDLPADLHRSLRARADAHHRSIAREALCILEDALADRAGPPPLDEIDRLRVRGRRPLTQALLDSARDSGRP
jgi:plasmid stability protein